MKAEILDRLKLWSLDRLRQEMSRSVNAMVSRSVKLALVLDRVKTASTPIETQKPLVKDKEAADLDVHLYRFMIGSLMYLTASRPDILFAVCACSRFQVTPKTLHLQAVKMIFRKSTIGGCQFLGRRLISWQCKKQTIMATFTSEAEYVAGAHCSTLVKGRLLEVTTAKQSKELASPKQMALGKDESNSLIVDSLLKTIWSSMHHVIAMKHWLFQSKRLLESSIRRTLKLYDEEGISCLANDEIFTGLANMSALVLKPPLEMNLAALWHQQSSVMPQTRSLTSQELVDLCTRLSNKVLDLESEIIDIKSSFTHKIEKLEDIVHMLEEENRIFKEKPFKSTAPVEDKEESFKQEKMIEDMDEDDINEEEPAEVEEVLEVVKAAKQVTKVVTTAEPTNTAAATQVPKESAPRRRRGIVIQDPEETATSILVHTEVQPKDKGKGILIEEPKPLKRQAKIKKNNEVMRYQALKRKPLTEAQARKNMMIYLKNMAGFKMNFFKGMTYGEIRPLFEKHYNSNQAFLERVEEEVIVQEKEIKEEEATPLASKVPVVDYQIHHENNKPYYKIIRADGTHKLFLSFITLLKNFNKEDLETFWKLVKEMFETTELKNFSDDFLLNILKIMFEKPNIEANMFLLVEKKYPLTHFTLEQMLNNVRLDMEEESEMSLELLRLVRRQLNEGVPSASKSSRSKSKEVKVEEHHRNLLHSKKNKHMSSACNSSKIDSQDVKSKVVCAKCKKCLNSVNHDVCLNNCVNGKKSRGQFCVSDLEVTFRRNACFVRNLEGVDLLKGDRSTNLYTINLHEMASASPICLVAQASSTKSWLWNQRLSHLNFDTINDLARNDLVAVGLDLSKLAIIHNRK
uniref:Putative ribonuclease H-like domain-containing protein n=1 Tax=Tanacetum cinerariifolium TaxID=118510 RepID=A0A6L2NM77_TANCI|nr:putative ribonuclease H-like domain-containing protein [Tanacetum cinerariifolium]